MISFHFVFFYSLNAVLNGHIGHIGLGRNGQAARFLKMRDFLLLILLASEKANGPLLTKCLTCFDVDLNRIF